MNILIVGGGSAGWMTAATFQSQFPNYNISLIESPDIKTVGVGESTLGQIQDWLRILNINYKDFLTHVDGSIKLSIKFTDFYKKGQYFHYPFGRAAVEDNPAGANDWWIKKIVNPDTPLSDYADCIYPYQMAYTNQNKFDPLDNNLSFAYHFDATKFGIWLRDHYCTKVKHILEDIKSVEQDEKGIVSLNNKYKADLYIDCTGFRSLLLGKTLNVPFESYNDLLPNDSAIATRIPYKDKIKELVPYTNCTAIENGWVWNIPSWQRIGTGYVYSSKFVDDETALLELQNHLGTKEFDYNKIKMRVGVHKELWVKNVVAIGLSSGFIEPLESNGLFSVHEFVLSLVRNLRRGQFSQLDRDSHNYYCKNIFQNFAEFVALHYALSHRQDTEYWKTNFNKKWLEYFSKEKAYINLLNRKNFLRNFNDVYDNGIHCIAAGCDFAPQDLVGVTKYDNTNKEELFKQFRKISDNLDIKKRLGNMKVENKKPLIDFLTELYND